MYRLRTNHAIYIYINGKVRFKVDNTTFSLQTLTPICTTLIIIYGTKEPSNYTHGLLMLLFVNVINMNDLIAKVIVQIVVIVGNYIISKMIVFKKSVR